MPDAVNPKQHHGGKRPRRLLYKTWQVFCAGVSYAFFGIVALLIGAVFRLMSPISAISPAKKQRLIRWCIHKGCLTFIRTLRFFGLIRYHFDIASLRAVHPGHIVTANHPSLIDVVLLLAVNEQICCIVKNAIWNNFFIGPVVRQAGFIPNNAEHFLPLAEARLKAGENILIFPEGTRTKADNIVRFKRGAANIAVAIGAPIMPVIIQCVPRGLKKGDKWYDIPAGGLNFTLRSSERLVVEDCIDITLPRPQQYRHLTEFLENYYKKQLEDYTLSLSEAFEQPQRTT